MKHLENAIRYVREHRSWTHAEETVALERIDRMRCNLINASSSIADKISDLMEEYGQYHDLPEGWWYEDVTEDDIFFEL